MEYYASIQYFTAAYERIRGIPENITYHIQPTEKKQTRTRSYGAKRAHDGIRRDTQNFVYSPTFCIEMGYPLEYEPTRSKSLFTRSVLTGLD